MDLEEVAKCFERLGIQFSIQSDQDILADLNIQKLVMLLEAVENFGDDTFLARAMYIDFLDINILDISKILNYSKNKKIDLLTLLSKIEQEKGLELANPKKVAEFYKKLEGWVSVSKNEALDSLLVKIINESEFKEYFLKQQQRYQTLNKLVSLFDEIRLRVHKDHAFNLKDFLNLLEVVKKHGISLRAKSVSCDEGGVKLLTVHKSKGLEFDFVYIINVFDGRWGNSKKRGKRIKLPWEYLGPEKKAVEFEEIEDERRLFYVGLTRARKGINLSYSKFDISGKEQLPSQFILEINPDLLEFVDTEKFERGFKKEVLFEEPAKVVKSQNIKFFAGLFLEKGLSATALDNFLECPWKYFFRNLVSLPDVKNKYMSFGTAVHYAIDSYIVQNKISKKGIEFLIAKFKEALEKEVLLERDKVELLEKGEKALKLFFENEMVNWPKDIQSEMVIKGVKVFDGVVLTGRLDMIEHLSADGSVRVHDFKTGKPKSRSQIDGSKDGKYNYLRQLIFYKILLDKHRSGLLKMKEGVIDFVEPDEKGRFHKEVFLISDGQVKELLVLIKSVSEQITTLSFWDRYCEEVDCEYCNLRKIAFN